MSHLTHSTVDSHNRLVTRRTPTVLSLLGLCFLAALALAGAASAEDSLDQILNQYYEAVGGQEAWSKIGNIKQVGSMNMMGMDAPFTVYLARPAQMRTEFEFQGMKGIQAFDGKSGWMLMPFMGSDKPEPMPEDMTEEIAVNSDLEGPLFNYKAKGHKVELVGKEDVEGTTTDHLRITLDSGKVMDWYLDEEYHVPIQSKMVISMQGQEFESTSTLSDYKEVAGVMMPFSMTQSSPMGNQVMTMKTVEVNVDLPKDFFAMPEAPAETKPPGSH